MIRSKLLLKIIPLTLCATCVVLLATHTAIAQQRRQSDTARIIKEVRHELATLPYYSVFDWLEFEVRPDSTVILRGSVTRPTTKSSAEANVKGVEGIERVVDQIKVLPLSPNDDRLRMALYRAIYNYDGPLFRYGLGSQQAIHIIVENGRATLKGIVDSEADRNMAYVKASGVPGVFAVNNELQVERGAKGHL